MQENVTGLTAENTIVPNNTKQMGSLENELRIYMEDYVYTYLCQYAKTGGGKEKLGILMGRHIINENQNIVIISGFIQGKHSLPEHGSETLTAESWKYINESRDKYFKELEIVGWVHTQPGFGGFLMSGDEAYHNEFFPRDHQVLYILDPAEKIDTFYIRNKESGRLRAAGGYFIYYDTNESMQDYMIDNRLVKPKEPPFYPDIEKPKKNGLFGTSKKNKEPLTINTDPASQGRERLKKRSAGETQKHRIAVLGGVSAILCACCIMICLNVMNHSQRIRNLEAEVTSAGILKSNDTATVFASQGISGRAESSENGYELNISSSPVKETEPEPEKPDETPKAEEAPVADPPAAETKAGDIPEYYVVEKGDSLSYISRKFYGSDDMISKIMEINGIQNSNKIYYGKKLLLPSE